MHKKLIAACMALAAFAVFAIGPATASARVLTHPTGKALAAGVKILGHQVGVSFLENTVGEPILECSTGTMTGTLLKNTGTEIEGEIESAFFGGTGPTAANEPEPECTGKGFLSVNASVTTKLLPWCISSGPLNGADEFVVSGGKCGGVASKIKFAMVTTGVGTCEYEATNAAIKGTIRTDVNPGEDAILTPTKTSTNAGFKLIAGGGFCPTTGMLDMSFTLETDTVNTEPIYFS